MSTVEHNGVRTGTFLGRIGNLLLKPAQEWDVIEREHMSGTQVFWGYVILLAAIPAATGFVASLVYGNSAFVFSYMPSLWSAGAEAVLTFAKALVMTWVLAQVINLMAPGFQGARNATAAYKVAAYSSTAAWLAGIFTLVPGLSFLGILGLYGFYLLYLGLPRLMKSSPSRSLVYTVCVVVIAIVLSLLLGAVIRPITRAVEGTTTQSTIIGNDRASVDISKVDEAARKLKDVADRMQAGPVVEASDPRVLESLMPPLIARAERGDITSTSNAAGQYSASSVEAVYAIGDGNLHLKITDIGAIGAMASLGTAVKVKSSHKDAEGYETVATIDGRLVSESFDNGTQHGRYSVLVKERILIEAEGDNIDMQILKDAVTAVGFAKTEALIP